MTEITLTVILAVGISAIVSMAVSWYYPTIIRPKLVTVYEKWANTRRTDKP